MAPTASVTLAGLVNHSAATQPAHAAATARGGPGSPADFSGNDSLALYTRSSTAPGLSG